MRMKWDQNGERFYETGIDRGVLYPQVNNAYPLGVPWNGLASVEESPSGAEANPIYADNIKYLNLISVEEFGATVTAYTYPDEWEACDGSTEVTDGVQIGQQTRIPFGLSYRTILGNDSKLNNYGYKIHIVYNALAAPSSKSFETVNDSPSAIEFSWEISTTPIPVEGYQPTATITIDSSKTSPAKLKAIEDILYGTDSTDPRLPLPDELIALMKSTTDSSDDTP